MEKNLHYWQRVRAAACMIVVTLSSGSFAASQGFRTISVDAGQVEGPIRSFQGVNGPPLHIIAGLPNLINQYKELRVDQVRTHDFMGPTDVDARFTYRGADLTWLIPDSFERAGVVREGNASTIFPEWNADPEKPESYRFGPTDQVISSIRQSGAEVYYRIGRSWGANTEPPPDADKYANIIKHIAMHYNQGWASGFHDNIRYWEFWNEPEGFWNGTPELLYTFYAKTAIALKSLDANLKVGGLATSVPHDEGPWREGFLDYCASNHIPLDFFSWHRYTHTSSDPYDMVRLGKEIRRILDTHGFPKAESVLSEWNLSPDFTILEAGELQGAHTAAFVGAVLTYLQDASVDHAHFYRVTQLGWGCLILMEDSSNRLTYLRRWDKCSIPLNVYTSRVRTQSVSPRWRGSPRMVIRFRFWSVTSRYRRVINLRYSPCLKNFGIPYMEVCTLVTRLQSSPIETISSTTITQDTRCPYVTYLGGHWVPR
jgi:hypothetical protein